MTNTIRIPPELHQTNGQLPDRMSSIYAAGPYLMRRAVYNCAGSCRSTFFASIIMRAKLMFRAPTLSEQSRDTALDLLCNGWALRSHSRGVAR